MADVPGFDCSLRTRLVYGVGTAEQTGALCAEIATGRALVVTDPGLVGAGHVEPVEASLREAGFDVARFEGVRENPTTVDVDLCLAAAEDFAPDLLVGLGGGSAIDVAKGCNFLYSCGGRMQDYWGVGKAGDPLLPLVAIPTTAGTGTEVQSFALIADEKTHQKMACGDVKAAPRAAVLDPSLTVTQPREVTAVTGLDAIGHAIETAVTRKRTHVSDLFAREAFRLARGAFATVLANPDDLEARGAMLRAAAFAGIAIENSMLGAAHAVANPLTARCGLIHGQAVGMMLPHVVRFNAEDEATAELYAALARAAGLASPDTSSEPAVDALVRTLEDLLEAAEMPLSLAGCGVDAADAGALAEEAGRQWTAGFNPRPVSEADLRVLIEKACAGPSKR